MKELFINKERVSETISLMRAEQNITLQELAEKTGLSYQTVFRYEHNDVKHMQEKTICKIADGLGINPMYLLGRTDLIHSLYKELIEEWIDYEGLEELEKYNPLFQFNGVLKVETNGLLPMYNDYFKHQEYYSSFLDYVKANSSLTEEEIIDLDIPQPKEKDRAFCDLLNSLEYFFQDETERDTILDIIDLLYCKEYPERYRQLVENVFELGKESL